MQSWYCQGCLYVAFTLLRLNSFLRRGNKTFQKSKTYFKILGARRVTWGKFQIEAPQKLGVTVQIIIAEATWRHTSWNVMAHGDARERKWRGNWRMEWVASTRHTTWEHGVSSITTADAHTSAASSRLNWRPRRFKWTRPFRQKTKSDFCACAITFQLASTACLTACVLQDTSSALFPFHCLIFEGRKAGPVTVGMFITCPWTKFHLLHSLLSYGQAKEKFGILLYYIL